MQTSPHKPFPDPATARALIDEADIGSGEKTPGQLETEEMIRDIVPLPPGDLDQRDAADDSDDDADDGAGAGRNRREHDASLERDEPSGDLDRMDPVPPKGS
jgi:hypothetical protein